MYFNEKQLKITMVEPTMVKPTMVEPTIIETTMVELIMVVSIMMECTIMELTMVEPIIKIISGLSQICSGVSKFFLGFPNIICEIF